jgi:hypothetical protein
MTSYLASMMCDGTIRVSSSLQDQKVCLVAVRVSGSNVSVVWVNNRATVEHKNRLVKAVRVRMAS